MLLEIDEKKIVPDDTKSIEEGAIAIWKEGADNWRIKQIHTLAKHHKDVTLPVGTELTFVISHATTGKKLSPSGASSN